MNPVTIGMRSSRGRTTAAALLGTASVFALGSSPAFGQATTVTITGSLIAGQAVGVPVTALSEEQFIEQGAITTADMLLGVPSVAVDPTLTSLRGGGTTGYGQNVAIHGFEGTGGDAITLMLIDGRRWPIQGHGGDTVDPSIIPQLALERVDILTAGASATYGADAIVGVINVILRRNFEGARSQVTVSSPVHIGQGWKFAASHIHGVSWDTGNVTLTAEAYFHQRVRASAIGRDLYTTNFEDTLGYDFTPIAMSHPGVISFGAPKAPTRPDDDKTGDAYFFPEFPNGVPSQYSAINGTRFCVNCYALPHGIGWEFGAQSPGPTTDVNSLVPFVLGQRNEQNQRINYDDSWALPQQTREAFVGTLNQTLTDDFFGLGELELLGTMFYSNRKGQMHFGVNTNSGNSREHASFRRADTGVTVPLSNPYVPTGIGPALESYADQVFQDVLDSTGDVDKAQDAHNEARKLRMNINATPLLGSPSRISFENIATRYQFGFAFNSLPWGWIGDVEYSMSNEQNNTHSTAMINRDRAARALGQTVRGATKPDDVPYLNVFCDALTWGASCNSQKTLDYIQGFRFQNNQWRIRQIDANFNGPLFELPSGEVFAALAAEHTSQHYWFRDQSNAGTADPDQTLEQDLEVATRVAHAFFGQINIPVLGGAWSIPGFVEGLDVQLGYRLDKFDFQDEYIRTPKVSADLTLGYGLTIRGAWGKSFRAPGFGQLSAAAGSRAIGMNTLGGGDNTYDFACDNNFNPSTAGTALPGSATAAINPTCIDAPGQEAVFLPGGIELAGGSGLGDFARGLPDALRPGGPPKGLGPERSKQYNLGLTFAPFEGPLAGLNVDVSYFNIKITDTIRGDGSGGADPDNPLARHLFVLRPSRVNPGADDSQFNAIIDALAALPSSTSTFDRTGRTYDFIVDQANSNVGFIHFKGIDFSARYDYDAGNWGTFHIGTSGYYELDILSQASDGSPIESEYDGEVDDTSANLNSGHRLQHMRHRAGWTSADNTWSFTVFGNQRFHLGPNNNIRYPTCHWADGFSSGSCYPGSPHFPQENPAFYNVSPGWIQWDLNVTYNTGMMPTNEYLQNINLSLTVNNFLDAKPPFAFNARTNAREIFAYDARFSELGRYATFTITKEW